MYFNTHAQKISDLCVSCVFFVFSYARAASFCSSLLDAQTRARYRTRTHTRTHARARGCFWQVPTAFLLERPLVMASSLLDAYPCLRNARLHSMVGQ